MLRARYMCQRSAVPRIEQRVSICLWQDDLDIDAAP